jgi:hypothetical protein
MNVGASERAAMGAPTPDGLDDLAEALKGGYPDIKPKVVGEILHLYGPGPSRYLVWDDDAEAPMWYSGDDHGAHLKPDANEAAAQIAVLMGSAHA